MKIRVFGQAGELKFPYGETGPWTLFRAVFQKSGHTLVEGGWDDSADAVIAHTHNSNIRKYIINNNIPLSRRILVQWEPSIVDNKVHKKNLSNFYGTIFSASPKWINSSTGKNFNWPQDLIIENLQFDSWVNRIDKAVIVQGNKYSARSGEKYSLRRKIIRSAPEEIDLYGTNWNKGVIFDFLEWMRSLAHSKLNEISISSGSLMGMHYPNYRGEIENKSRVMSKYQYSIVIENSNDFVSEKLFDAVRYGCIPIYCGPKLKDFGISNILEVENSVMGISRALDFLRGLSMEQKFEIAAKFQKELSSVSKLWENNVVLPKLAKDAIAILEN